MPNPAPPSPRWDSPLPILGTLLFGAVLLALFLFAEPGQAPKEFGRSLFTELVGFLFTAGAIGWLFARHERSRREAVLRRQHMIAAQQIQRVKASLAPILAGQFAFGPQYSSDVTRTIAMLEHLDSDCADLLLTDIDTDRAETWARFRQLTRELAGELLSIQRKLSDFDSAPASPLPTEITELMNRWETTSATVALGQ